MLLLHVLFKIVTKCLVTGADTSCESKPLSDRSHEPISALACTHIGPHVPTKHQMMTSFTLPRREDLRVI